MSDQDFVERLRIRWEAMGDMANSERAAAADEIEFLRRSQRELMGQVATLREERDEARRMFIFRNLDAEVQLAEAEGRDFRPVTPQNFAQQMRWDCYKQGDVHVEP